MRNHKYIIDGNEYNVPDYEVDSMILEMDKFEKQCFEIYPQHSKNTDLKAFSFTVFMNDYIKKHFQKYIVNEKI